MKKIKVFFIQNILSFYRKPLFKKIAYDPSLDFTLILHASNEPHRDESWKVKRKTNLGYKHIILHTIKIKKQGYDPYIYLSYDYFYKLLKHKPDVVICAGFSFATIQSYIYAKLFNKKFIIWMEGTKYTEQFIGKKQQKIREFLASKTNVFVVAGIMSKEYIKSLSNKNNRFYTSYNCNDTHFISEFCKERNQNDAMITLLYSGKMVESKGIFEVVKAFEVLNKKSDKYKLILLGNGKLFNIVKEYIGSKKITNVEMPGFVKFEESLKFWKNADILIHLAHYDRNPLIYTEALAAGLPIISSKYVGSNPEFVHNGKNGFVVDPFNVEGVCNAVEKVIDGNRDGSFSEYSRKLSKMLTYENAAKGFIDAIYYAYHINRSKSKNEK